MILDNGWESSACRMRIYGKFPTVEYLIDDLNAVPFIHVFYLSSLRIINLLRFANLTKDSESLQNIHLMNKEDWLRLIPPGTVGSGVSDVDFIDNRKHAVYCCSGGSI